MTEVKEILDSLGLSQYCDIFVAEGFDTWETLLDITESDLNSLEVKLGHRRKLQRAIAETRVQSIEKSRLGGRRKAGSIDGSYRTDDSAGDSKPIKRIGPAAPGSSTKRKYRRHPKPDANAPERPASAYVIFSNQVRESVKGQDLSFTEIAKVVGERWQVLPSDLRETCERQAAAAKEKYYAELAEYKKTPEYSQYQQYLADFKAKHASPADKRSKLETETSISIRSSSHEDIARAAPRRVSSGLLDSYSVEPSRADSTPSPGSYPTILPTHASHSKTTSPATHSFSGLNSPMIREHYSTSSGSPMSTSAHRDSPFDLPYQPPGARPVENRDRQDPGFASHHSSAANAPFAHRHVNTPGPTAAPVYHAQFQSVMDITSRRPARDSLPPLVHRDTSSRSSENSSLTGVPYQGSLLPPIDAPKALRILPQPVPTAGAAPSPLDQLSPAFAAPPHPPPPLSQRPNQVLELRQEQPRRDASRAGAWPALLHAATSELARNADKQAREASSRP